MVGSGRSLGADGFLAKLDAIEGYIVSDIEKFPRVPFWIIPAEIVREWWDAGILNADTKITRAKALQLLKTIYPDESWTL